MNTRQILAKWLVAAVVLGLGGATALAGDGSSTSFYLDGDVGAVLQQQVDFSGTFSGEAEFDVGMRIDLKGGVKLNRHFAVEIETGFLGMSVNEVDGMEVDDVAFSQVPLLFNAVYTFPLMERLEPFVGGGLGCAFSTLSFDDTDAGEVMLDGASTDVVFAYQAFGGLRYRLSDRVALGFVYKFLGTSDHTWEVDYAPDLESDATYSHSFMVTVNWKL